MSDQIARGIDAVQRMDLNAKTTTSVYDQPKAMSQQYGNGTRSNDTPHLSPFPRLPNLPPNVPPSDEDLEATLENARDLVLNSGDPEMQLAWAADALVYAGVCADHEERLAVSKPNSARSATPRVEHQIKVDAMNITIFLADQHHPKAEFLRGMWLEWGRFGQREDKKEAFRCYSRAADRGYARAEYRIGMLYESYNDPVKALKHYHTGVATGDAASCYRLGMMTLRGQHGQQQNYSLGVDLIRRSAEAADENAAQGAYVYGMLLARQLPQIELPDGILAYDEQQARMNIEKAAYLKFAKAQVKMGSAYELGSLGCEFSPGLSVHYNALASKQGEAEADMALSKWFLVGSEGLFPKNEELAYTHAERASQSGLATAEFALGYFSEIGMYVPVDLDKALEWYQKASKHGNKDAGGRIESLSRKQVLSRKDHENVAIYRIKSQHGSMRGQRPDRFRQQQQPSRLGQSMSADDRPASYSSSNASQVAGAAQLPPRGTTPYPESDGPTIVPLPDRASSVTPYPLADGPPKIDGVGPVGGFFNAPQQAPARPSTMLNPDVRPSSAFQLAPDLRASSVGPSIGSQPQYPASRPLHANSIQPSARPFTAQPYDPRLRPGIGGRINSGPATVPTQSYASQQTAPRPVVQQQAPLAPTTASAQSGQAKLDIGFSAPADDRHRRQYGSARPQQSQKPNPNQPAQRVEGAPNLEKPLPLSVSKPAKTSKPSPQQLSSIPSNTTTTTTPSKPPLAHASTVPGKVPGKGPKTFDEMGVPATKQEGDCVSFFSVPATQTWF